MKAPKYGVFVYESEFVYITDVGNFCFFKITDNLDLKVMAIPFYDKDDGIWTQYYHSSSPYKPLYFIRGFNRLGCI